MPVNEYFSFATEQFADNIFVFGNSDFIDSRLLQLFLTFHRPTFVHSLMVAKLTEVLFRELYHNNPSFVLSMMDISESSADEISMYDYFQKAYTMGLFHDLGKIIIIIPAGTTHRLHLDITGTSTKVPVTLIIMKGPMTLHRLSLTF